MLSLLNVLPEEQTTDKIFIGNAYNKIHQLFRMELFILIAVVQDSGMEGSKMYGYLQKKKGQIIPSPTTTQLTTSAHPSHIRTCPMLYVSLGALHLHFLYFHDGGHDATQEP